MSDTAYLAMLLDGPLQSWGFASRFERRTTGLHPTKSGIIGLICAAMGLAKGSPEEREVLPELAASKMMSIAIPREAQSGGNPLPLLRLEDYHTVLGTRRASGKPNPGCRYYATRVPARRPFWRDHRSSAACPGVRRGSAQRSGLGGLARPQELHSGRTDWPRVVRYRSASPARACWRPPGRRVYRGNRSE